MRIELITSDGAKLARDAKAQNKGIVFTRAIEFILGDGRCFEVTVDAIQEI